MNINSTKPRIPQLPEPGMRAMGDIKPLFQAGEQSWVETSDGQVFENLDQAFDHYEKSPRVGKVEIDHHILEPQTNKELVQELKDARWAKRKKGLVQGGLAAGLGVGLMVGIPSSVTGPVIAGLGAAWAGLTFVTAGSMALNHFQDRYEETGISEIEEHIDTYSLETVQDKAGEFHDALSDPTPWKGRHYYVVPEKNNPEVAKVRKFDKYNYSSYYRRHIPTGEMTWSVLYNKYGNAGNEYDPAQS